MSETLHIIVLPTTVTDGPPQVLFDDGGIWRETIPPPVTAPQTKLRQDIESFLSGVMKQVGQIPPPPVSPQGVAFRNHFANLLQALLPREVRDAMKHLADEADRAGGPRPQLNVFFRAGTEWIPWELLHDGRNYLGLRFAIARLPIVAQATEVRPPRDRQVRKVYSLLAKDVLEAPLLAEWESTFTAYATSPNWECRFPANGGANYPTLGQLDEARDADVVHVTCHGGLKEAGQSEYFWTLDHQNPHYYDYRITPGIAQDAKLSGKPLVFGNACASAATQPADLASLQGFGASFMVGGALNFVGTFAPITKTMAVKFAKRFYNRLFGTGGLPSGVSIGEALRATKESFAVETCADPSYLFYCLYGPCDSTYTPV